MGALIGPPFFIPCAPGPGISALMPVDGTDSTVFVLLRPVYGLDGTDWAVFVLSRRVLGLDGTNSTVFVLLRLVFGLDGTDWAVFVRSVAGEARGDGQDGFILWRARAETSRLRPGGSDSCIGRFVCSIPQTHLSMSWPDVSSVPQKGPSFDSRKRGPGRV